MIWLRALIGGNGLVVAVAFGLIAAWGYHKLTVNFAYSSGKAEGGQIVASQYERQISTVNTEASARASDALATAQSEPDAPSARDELVRLCRAEPAGCRTRDAR
jgi:hypothetical protein